MIVALRGRLEAVEGGSVVVAVGPLSLRVFMPLREREGLGPPGSEVHLYTELVVRPEEIALYGFASPQSARMFRLLQEVSGVGPRLALALLAHRSPDDIAHALQEGDANALAQVPGIGRKTAGRLVVELGPRIRKEWGPVAVGGTRGQAGPDREVVDALVALGYTPAEARRAVEGLPADLPLEERVRQALRRLAQP